MVDMIIPDSEYSGRWEDEVGPVLSSTSTRHLQTATPPSSDCHTLSLSASEHYSTISVPDDFRHRLPVEVIECIIKWLGRQARDPCSE